MYIKNLYFISIRDKDSDIFLIVFNKELFLKIGFLNRYTSYCARSSGLTFIFQKLCLCLWLYNVYLNYDFN